MFRHHISVLTYRVIAVGLPPAAIHPQQGSRQPPGVTLPTTPAGLTDTATLLASLPTPASLLSTEHAAGYVRTRPAQELKSIVTHVRAASASLRRYNLPPAPSAIAPTSTLFARKPRPSYKMVRVCGAGRGGGGGAAISSTLQVQGPATVQPSLSLFGSSWGKATTRFALTCTGTSTE
jgi:hypothetical protein